MVDEIEGRARSNPEDPRSLLVDFPNFSGGKYYILDIDDDYQWSIVVSSACQKHERVGENVSFWLLSRTREVPGWLINQSFNTLKKYGYNIDKFIMNTFN